MSTIKTIVLSNKTSTAYIEPTEQKSPKAEAARGGFVPGGIVFTAKVSCALRICCLSALVIAALFSGEVHAAVEFKYSTGVTEKQRELLAKDLQRIQQMPFSDSTGEARRIMKLPDMSGASLEAWLQVRARYIIDEKHPLNGLTLFAIAPVQYPAAPVPAPSGPSMELPSHKEITGVDGAFQVASEDAPGGGETPSTQSSPTQPKEEAQDTGPTIVMGNMGAALYMLGRANRILVGFNMMGQGIVPIHSPRVGLFQVGRGMFMPLSPRWAPEVIEDFVHSMFRMDTLFHEARHSDGSVQQGEKQLGFSHEICPAGHEFAGFPACDRPSNGPYRIGSLIMKTAIEGCGRNCETRDKEILTLLYADSMSRILTTPAQSARLSDDDLCTKLLKTRRNIPFCEAPDTSQVIGAVEWEETPEGVEVPAKPKDLNLGE